MYDIAIIGAGPGGYTSAIRASRLGAKVLLIEKDNLGGVCLNWGCIPTKTILKSALIYRQVKKASIYGVTVENHKLDFCEVMRRKEKVVKALANGIKSLLESNRVDVINGTAHIADKNSIVVNNSVVQSQNIIVAAGSSTFIPPIDGIEDSHVMHSNDALSLDKIPESIVIIGGGVIGIEFASAFNDFGSKVTILELRDGILPGFDSEVSEQVRKILTRSGIEIITSAVVKSIKDGVVTYEQMGNVNQKTAEKILVAVGRKPNSNGLFSENLDIETKNGYIITDLHMRTSINNIYAIGDINGKEMLAHTAYAEGKIASENALGVNSEMSYNSIPKCVYTYPEIAMVGLTEEEAIQVHGKIKVGKQPLRSNGRALAEGNIEGFCKIISSWKDNSILGVHIIAPYAAEMINVLTLAIAQGIKDYELSRLVYPHPAISEIIGDAFIQAVNQ